jgi:DNA-binding NarL/FixJ family response regulator
MPTDPFCDSRPHPTRQGKTFLHTTSVVVVDNQTVARIGTCKLLAESTQIDVVGDAETGEEALRLARALEPDVFVVEMRLPDLSGAEVAKRLTQAELPSHVLILSAYVSSAALEAFVGSGAVGYLRKQEDPDRLIEAVRGAGLGHAGWFSAPIMSRLLTLRQNLAARWDPSSLTARENETLQRLMKGDSNQEIANVLGISVGTVKNHLTSVYKKLGVSSRAEAIVRVRERGLLRWPEGK